MRRSSRRLRVVGVALVILVSHTVTPGAAIGQEVDPVIAGTEDPLELQQLAVQFIALNQPSDAILALQKALRSVPNNAETFMWLGVAQGQLGATEEAETSLTRALEINPNLTEARNWLGVHYAQRGDTDRAFEQYEIALADPAYPRISRARVLANLSKLHAQRGNLDEAIPLLGEAARAPIPSNDPLYAMIRLNLGEALIMTGRAEEAIAALEQLANLPADARVELLTGLAFRDLGEKERARDHLQAVLRLAPGSTLSSRALEVLETLGTTSRRR